MLLSTRTILEKYKGQNREKIKDKLLTNLRTRVFNLYMYERVMLD